MEKQDTVEIYKKEYDGESISDIERDLYEAFDVRSNEKASAIVTDQHGIAEGCFILTLEYIHK